jgi:adenylosuccinate synthase
MACMVLCRINGLTHINLTKLDVLSELETIRLGVGYKLNGKAISGMPSEIADVEKVEVVYEDIPGWQTDISKVRPQSSQSIVEAMIECKT